MTNHKATTVCHCVTEFPSRPGTAIRYYKNQAVLDLSWPQYYELIVKMASALHKMGVKKNSKVALMANTRFEWAVLDHAIMGLGAQTVPVYQTTTTEDLEFILNNSQSEVLIVENRTLYRSFTSIQANCKQVKKVLSIDPIDSTEELIPHFHQLTTSESLEFATEFNKRCLSIEPSDVATILYTSGTTGLPKGVVLTHDSAFCEVSEAFPYCGATALDTSLSFLPYAHILGRIEHWGHTFIGTTLAFAESIERVRHNLAEIQPTYMMAVPRIFEKIYGAIQAQLETNPLKKRFAVQAVAIGKKVSEHRLRGTAVPLSLALQYEVAKKLVLSKVKEAFGGKLRFAISGGAPLNREIGMFFHACDVLILEGYGLTETTAAICVNTPFDYQFGTVGKPIGEAQIKIAEDGEIMIRSRKVMREYLGDPQATKEAFTDGWFHTGDIGELTPGGRLKITDRKKDLIKTAGGKYVAPQKLEGLLKLNPFISHALIHGDQKKYIVALLTLDKAAIIQLAKDKEITYSDYDALIQSATIQELVRKAVADANAHLGSYESIKRFTILPTDFTIESGELTPSLKVKRKVLDKKYAHDIDKLYL